MRTVVTEMIPSCDIGPSKLWVFFLVRRELATPAMRPKQTFRLNLRRVKVRPLAPVTSGCARTWRIWPAWRQCADSAVAPLACSGCFARASGPVARLRQTLLCRQKSCRLCSCHPKASSGCKRQQRRKGCDRNCNCAANSIGIARDGRAARPEQYA